MAPPNQKKDILTRLSDAGEDAISKLTSSQSAGRLMESVGGLRERIEDVQKKLRGVDELEKRVAKLEKDVAALRRAQKPASEKAPTRRA